MTAILDRYLSFNGRLARLSYFIRSVYLGIAASVIFVASIALFSSARDLLWWIGLSCVIVCLALLAVGSASLIVRRLHDLGLSGYHAIWVAAGPTRRRARSAGPGE